MNDPDFVVQGIYSDSRVCESDGCDDEEQAITMAKIMLGSPYFEGSRVTVITRDGEIVWDSCQE